MQPFNYYGGKTHLAQHIIPLLPPGKIYVEPYCGAASIFWHLRETYPIVVLNDLDERVINVFRVLQNPETFDQFCHRIFWTPYSRAEFKRAIELLESADPVERAWAFYTVTNQSISADLHQVAPGRWSRALTVPSTQASLRWRARKTFLRRWHDRLSRVNLECRDALEVIQYWDTPQTVFYIDPPYVPETRKDANKYHHEADIGHHQKLVEILLQIQGSAVLSGYDHPVYKPLEEAGWERREIKTFCKAAAPTRKNDLKGTGRMLAKVPRVEIVWRKANEPKLL